jgi:ABC-type bacteriocin/lantibiotic exporter with double-glycine peptidase domain
LIQLYLAIWRISGRRQIVLILLSVAIAALAAVPLAFQKEIINILAKPGPSARILFLLGAGMLVTSLISLSLKWLSGYQSGVLGEDTIRVIRRRLFRETIQTETGQTSIPAGTLTTVISAEAEELGKFAGGAFSDPVMQVGTLISVIGFIAATQPGLGSIALAMIVPQVILVLATQSKVNALVAKRVKILRGATNRIVTADFDEIEKSVLEDFDTIFETRRRMFVWKLSTKFLLSAINIAGTIGVLMLGGWLVLQNRTDVGTVVAATMGLARLQAPTTFLIAFYRQVSATRVKFELLRDVIPRAGDMAAAKEQA